MNRIKYQLQMKFQHFIPPSKNLPLTYKLGIPAYGNSICQFLVAPAVARCEIGICLSSISLSFRSLFKLTLAFRSIQMIYSLKPLHPWISNFPCSMIRLQGLRMVKFRLVENPRWPLIQKNIKTNRINFFLQNGLEYLAEILYGA